MNDRDKMVQKIKYGFRYMLDSCDEYAPLARRNKGVRYYALGGLGAQVRFVHSVSKKAGVTVNVTWAAPAGCHVAVFPSWGQTYGEKVKDAFQEAKDVARTIEVAEEFERRANARAKFIDEVWADDPDNAEQAFNEAIKLLTAEESGTAE